MNKPFFAEHLVQAFNHYLETKQYAQLGDVMLIVDLPSDHSPYRKLEIHGVIRDTKHAFEANVLVPFFESMPKATYYRVDNPPIRMEEGGGFASIGLTNREAAAAKAFIDGHERPIWLELLSGEIINGFLIVKEHGVPAIYEVLGMPGHGTIVVYPYAVTIASTSPAAFAISDFVGGAQKIVDMHVGMLGRPLEVARYSLISEPETASMALSAFGYSTTRKVESPGRRVEVHLGQSPLINQFRRAQGMEAAAE